MLLRLVDKTTGDRVGKFSLIDLAGAERGADHETSNKKTQVGFISLCFSFSFSFSCPKHVHASFSLWDKKIFSFFCHLIMWNLLRISISFQLTYSFHFPFLSKGRGSCH